MTKKGYQKRLPTVLPAPVLPAPVPPAGPAAPAPRIPAARVPEEDADDPGAMEPVEPVDLAPDVRPAQERTRTRSAGTAVMIAAAALLVVALVAGWALLDGPEEAPDARTPSGARGGGAQAKGAFLAADESYVSIRVLDSGDITVDQRMRLASPLDSLRLAPPSLPGADVVTATEVQVVADGTPVDGPRELADGGTTYSFSPTTYLEVRYRMAGAVQTSPSVDGRALALATSLDVLSPPLTSRETRRVSASRVLSLACAPSTGEVAVPCGEASGDGTWRVELKGRRVADRVVAQIDLG